MIVLSAQTTPAFFALNPAAEFDSFLTIGIDGPALTPGALSFVGMDFGTWTEATGISSEQAAVFFIDPDHGATVEPVVFMQLTVRSGSTFRGQLSAQGRTVLGQASPDWSLNGQAFDQNGAVSTSPPPPPRPPPPPPGAPPPYSPQQGVTEVAALYGVFSSGTPASQAILASWNTANT